MTLKVIKMLEYLLPVITFCQHECKQILQPVLEGGWNGGECCNLSSDVNDHGAWTNIWDSGWTNICMTGNGDTCQGMTGSMYKKAINGSFSFHHQTDKKGRTLPV